MIGHGRVINNPQGSDHLHLLIPNVVGGHGIRRLHGDQTEQLHQVILQHVSQLSDLIVIRKTTINADGFRHRDLHMVDAGIVPLGIDKTIGKTQRQQILDCFLAQIVINAINPVLVKEMTDGFVHFFAIRVIPTDGFF